MNRTDSPLTARKIATAVLSLGLSLVIARLGVDPRWRFAVWGLIAANELRGLAMVYEFGAAAFRAAAGV